MQSLARMANQAHGNGRNGRDVALPDENRPSWRPQDENGARNRRPMYDDDDDDRFLRGRYWEDREHRDWDRYGEDRGYRARNQGYPGAFEDRYRDRDRSGTYNTGYNPERSGAQGGYGGGRGWEPERIGPSRNREREQDYGTGGMHTGYGSGHSMGGQNTGYQSPPPPVVHHRGKGPASYQRSDERIREMICEALTDDDRVDATYVEVSVKDGEVCLAGTVADRQQKRFAEDCVEQISGVKDVQNQLRVGHEKPARTRTS